jgi:hypothetical protein
MGKDARPIDTPRSFPPPIFLPSEPLSFEPNNRAFDWACRELARVIKEFEKRRAYGGAEISIVFQDGIASGDVRVRPEINIRL